MEFRVHILDLPYGIHGLTVFTLDCYTILLNARDSAETNLKAYNHEIEHIMNNDFEKNSVSEIEIERHNPKSSYVTK